MRHALLICIKDLRQRLRDRTAILTAIVAPLALTALMGLALGGSQGGIRDAAVHRGSRPLEAVIRVR